MRENLSVGAVTLWHSPVFDGLQGDAGGFGAERERQVERQALLGALGLGALAALWI